MNVATRDSPAFEKKRPNLLILGVQKSATTTLFDTLKGMRGFCASSQKEVHFFDTNHNFQKGLDWYLDFFIGPFAPIRFEATPAYIYSKDAASRIHDCLGPMKFIVMLRDPVKRCFSAWNMYRTFNSVPSTAKYIYERYIKNSNEDVKGPLAELLFCGKFPSFDQCVNDDIARWKNIDTVAEPSFVRRGFYYEQVQRYLEYYSIDDFLFLEQDEFKQDVCANLIKICEFLQIEMDLDGIELKIISNRGNYDGESPREDASTLLGLYDVYRESNRKLFALLGREFPWNPSRLSA